MDGREKLGKDTWVEISRSSVVGLGGIIPLRDLLSGPILILTILNSPYSDMYTDTKHFSSTTMSAISNISEHAKYKKKADYTWRKDMEE